MSRIIIVGAGPAGLMAAIAAAGARQKNEICLLEKNPSPGRKILVTGNGRCNLTNASLDLDAYNGDRNWLKRVLLQFDNRRLMSYFNSLGVKLKEEEFGRILPVTDQASTILDALLSELAWHKMPVNCAETVAAVTKNNNVFTVRTDRSNYTAEKVILAAGGCAHPQLGSTRQGYELAVSLGHTLKEPHPALVPLELEGNWFHKLQGVKVYAGLSVRGPEFRKSFQGELLFTHFGISGPVVLDASRIILDNFQKPGTNIFLNFLEAHKPDDLPDFLDAGWKERPQRSLSDFFSGILPKKLSRVLFSQPGMPDGSKSVGQVSRKEQRQIISTLSAWPIEVKASRPFTEAMVTAGGISTGEINPMTMESRLTPGLYLAGEIVDIDGLSGGYNLQFAFSSGWVAGTCAGNS